MGWNAGAVFSNLTLDIIKDCIPHCVQMIYQWNGQWSAAVSRLGYPIFRKKHEYRLSRSLLFIRAFWNSQSSWRNVTVILEPKQYRKFTRLFSHSAKSSLGTRLNNSSHCGLDQSCNKFTQLPMINDTSHCLTEVCVPLCWCPVPTYSTNNYEVYTMIIHNYILWDQDRTASLELYLY